MRKLYHNGFDVSGALKQSGSYVDVAWPVYTSSIDIEYLVIGGGGGGACEDSFYNNGPGGGGGAGAVETGSFSFATGSTDLTLRVGLRGLGGSYPNGPGGSGDGDGGDGYSSYISGIVTAESGSQGKTVHANTADSPIGGKSGTPFNGGQGSTYDHAGGGGGGSASPGTNGSETLAPSVAVGGNGGNGLTINTWYVDESTPLGNVAGGGGGGAGNSTTNSGGSGAFGGGDGGDDIQAPTNATTFGSGGGGGYRDDAGDGKGGLVLLRYENILPINDSGDSVYKIGNYWYHKFATAATDLQTFERPDKIIIDI